MSVAITAQVPVESFATPSPATASPQAGQGTGATTEQGLVDFFAKARLDAGNGQTAEATNSVASSGDMLGKLREFIDKAHHGRAVTQVGRFPHPMNPLGIVICRRILADQLIHGLGIAALGP